MKLVTLSLILQVYVWPQHFHSRFVIDDIPFHNNCFPSIAKRFSQFCLSCFWVSVGIATEIRSKGRFANILSWHVGMEPRIKSTRFSWLPNLQPCHCILSRISHHAARRYACNRNNRDKTEHGLQHAKLGNEHTPKAKLHRHCGGTWAEPKVSRRVAQKGAH